MMNISYSNLIKKVIGLSLLVFISACETQLSPTPSQLGSPIVSPSETTFASTAIEVSNTAAFEQPNLEFTPLPQSADYIIYSKHKTSTDYEIWAISPDKSTPHLVTANITPRDLSPSNKLWLFTGNRSIYIANSNGSNIHIIHNYKEYKGVDPFWLTDDVVLFNAYKDYLLPPDMYSLDINSGAITQLFPGSNQFIQAAFPSEKKWLLSSWSPGSISIVDENGKTEKFFNEYLINPDPFAPYQKIQYISKLNKYLFIAKGPADTNYKLWLASRLETHQVLFDPGSDGIDQFGVSPDEQYVALTVNKLNGAYLYIFSLDNLQLLYKWVYPYKLGSGYFTWSPDSQSIVLYYSDSDTGITSGIQIMDVTTGKTKIILKEDINLIIGWHYIP